MEIAVETLVPVAAALVCAGGVGAGAFDFPKALFLLAFSCLLSHNGRMVGKRLPTKDRFAAKFERRAESECWPWTASTNGMGYGMIWSPEFGRKILAHRYSYMQHFGALPASALVLHSCDNPACVNPAHLRIGNHKQNVADMDARKRRVSNTPKGEANCNAKMTADAVIKLRQRYVAGDALSDLVRDFGCTETSLKDYTTGRSWKHVLGKDGCPTWEDLKAEGARRRRNSAILCADEVIAIRAAIAGGESNKSIALRYGLKPKTISDIKTRKNWADVP